VTTGISAADRAHTTRLAASPDCRPEDLVTPGHVFPLRARKGGVLVRTGQTEGSVDLARLAGLTPAGVICEIMNEDGSMARMPDLEVFAQKHDLRILTDRGSHPVPPADRAPRAPRRPSTGSSSTRRAPTGARRLRVGDDGRQFLALVKGELDGDEPTLCRVHAGSLVADLFASTPATAAAPARGHRAIEAEGAASSSTCPRAATSRGELEPTRITSSRHPRAAPDHPLREFGLGAQVLADLGAPQDPPAHQQPA
jgi:3,4-dihydroxy 2-butanone 4-phosphate synthase/GTP cyclohydrolase II